MISKKIFLAKSSLEYLRSSPASSIAIVKYHFFATSICNGFLDFDSFLLRLKNDVSVLREISFQNQTVDKFKSTWARLL